MSIKLDDKQQEQIIEDLKSREVSGYLLDAVAGGISIENILPIKPKYPYATTLAIGEETPHWISK